MESVKFWFLAAIVRIAILIADFPVATVTLLMVPVALFVVVNVIPVFDSTSWMSICRRCGTVRVETHVRCFDIPVKRQTDQLHAIHVEDYYDRLLGDEHEHQWIPGYVERNVGRLWHWESPVRLIWTDDDSPVYQPRLTQMALSMADFLRYSSQSFREELFDKLIGSVQPDAYRELCTVYDSTAARRADSAQDVWQAWLERKPSPTPGGHESSPVAPTPKWAYRATDQLPPSGHGTEVAARVGSSDFSRSWFYPAAATP